MPSSAVSSASNNVVVAPQIGADITEALDVKVAPTLALEDLNPSYGLATLRYAIDTQQRLCLDLSISLFWSPVTFSVLLMVNAAFINYKLAGLTLLQFIKWDVSGSLHCLIFFMASFAGLLLCCKLQSYFLKEQGDLVESTGAEDQFGVDLREFISVKKNQAKKLEQIKVDNAKVAVYRKLPIGMIAYQPVKHDDDKQFEITAIGGRKVYIRSGIYEDLLDWVLGDISQATQGDSFQVSMQCYSFDSDLKKLLVAKKFECVKKVKANGIIGTGLFGISKDEYVFKYQKDN